MPISSHTAKRSLVASLLTFITSLPLVAQVNGTWITAGSGTFSTGTNWQDGTIPSADGTANFNTVNLPTGAATVTFDTAVSLSALTFGDTDTSTAGTWAIAGTSTITLGGSTPTITTNVTTAVNAGVIFAGSNGFTKEGSGQLTILSNAFTLTGPINLNAGTLAINRVAANVTATVGTGQINMANGTTFRLDSAGSTFVSNAISIATGATVTISSANAANGYSGSITGDASATLNILNNASQSFSFSASGVSQLANFSGTVNIASGNTLRFSSTGGSNGNGGVNATFIVDGSITTRNASGAGGIVLGALTGASTGILSGQSNTTAGDVLYIIGGKNINGTFAGSITNGAQGTASIRKVGVGTQTFTGSMASNGTISVNEGVANFSGGFSKTGTGVITVNSGGTLSGSNANLAGAATVASGGFLRPNSAPANATDRLTFATALTLASGSTTTFDISGANYTGITLTTAESLTYGGALNINFSSGISAGTFDLFNFSDTNTGTFTSVTVSNVGSLTFDSGTWTGSFAENSFSFVEATGDFTVSASAIPEPSTYAAILGAMGLGFAALRRRRS